MQKTRCTLCSPQNHHNRCLVEIRPDNAFFETKGHSNVLDDRLGHSIQLKAILTCTSPSNRLMSSFDAMARFTSFKSSYGASSVVRPIAFGNYFHTIWLPARPMTPIFSPSTVKSVRCASGAEFRHTEFYTDRRPKYRILLQYGTDEPIDAPLHPLRSLRQAMHQALYVHDRQRARSLSTIKNIFELYTALLGRGSLEPVDTLVIAKLLVVTLRDRPLASTGTALSKYISIFASHYVTKALPPHSEASTHLLVLYRITCEHEMGARLWGWMVRQDDRYVSIKTYAEAIVSAATSNQSLRVCEELYEEALIRCSDNHVSLILSPGYRLPHDLQDSFIRFIKPHLCLAIFDARLRKGDWRTAYLNLDKAFNLWPSTINHLFLKEVLKGRPVHEGYQVYTLFCQAGAYVRGKELHLLLNPMARACGDSVDFGLKLDLIKAMLEAILVFGNIKDARLDARHLDCLIRGFLSILPHQGLGRWQKDIKVDTAVSSFLSYLMEWFSTRGSEPGRGILVTVIFWSGKLRNTSLLKWALQQLGDMDQNVTLQSLRNNCSPVDRGLYDSLLYAAGEFRSPEMVKIAWECLARSLERSNSLSGWRAFAEAAKKTGLVPYYSLQLDLFVSKGEIEALAAKQANYVARSRPSNRLDQAMYAETPDIRIAIEAFLQDARAILEDLESTSSNRAKNIPLNRCSIWRWPVNVPEEWQRRLYNEMSAKSSVELAADLLPYIGGKARKSMGFSYRELRYRSWKTINNLLLQAEAFEHRKERLGESQDSTDGVQTIAKSKLFKRDDGSTRPDHLPWLLEHLDDIEKESNRQFNEEEWREKIFNLRSPNYRYARPKQTA